MNGDEGAIAAFGEEELIRKYRGDRVIMWLQGRMSSDILEEHIQEFQK